jgi:hypothetical protein
VGVFFVGFAILTGFFIVSNADGTQSPLLFICLFGGIFSLVPGALGIGVIVNHRRTNRGSN